MIRKFLKKMGFDPAPELEQMKTWKEWYQGDVKNFHTYKVYNGRNFIQRGRDSMQMAKQVCADWASLLMSEQTSITSVDSRMQELLDYTLDFNDFDYRANQLIELTFAFGTGAFVEFLDEDENIVIDYVRGDCIYPLTWENGEITECAFASARQTGNNLQYYVTIHAREENGNYFVSNHMLNEKGEELPLPDHLVPAVYTNSPIPRFQIIRPNLVNNINLDSPYGISVFANAIGRLKKVDLIFDSGNNEFSLGRKRIVVPLTMAQVKVSEAEGQRPIFDPNDVAFYGLNLGSNAENQKPIDLTGQLRIEEHSRGLQDALNYLSDGVGLGTDRYEFTRSGGVKTATEVISEKSTLYQNLQRHKLPIESALRDMCKSIAVIGGLNPDVDVSIDFDDSIIEDKAAIKAQAMLEYQSGIIDEVEYFIETRGLTEEEALKLAQEIKARQGPMMDEVDFYNFKEDPADDFPE